MDNQQTVDKEMNTPQHKQISQVALSAVRIVMVETSHPGNIGSAARALKTMGLTQLVLVKPKQFPDGLAVAMASGAADVLQSALVVSSLEEAVSGCSLVIGTSARQRTSAWPQVDARSASELVLDHLVQDAEVALVFGRENSGLTNQELDLCHYLGHVDTNPEYGVLNVAMGIQLFVYELRMQWQNRKGYTAAQWRRKPASMDELSQLYAHLEQTLLEIDYLKPAKNDRIMRRMKRLFHRAQLEGKELLIFRGILRSMQRIAQLAKGSANS